MQSAYQGQLLKEAKVKQQKFQMRTDGHVQFTFKHPTCKIFFEALKYKVNTKNVYKENRRITLKKNG